MNSNLTKDRFYSQIIKLVIPIVIQNLLSAAVNSADVVMLNYVGQSSISAVSLAANYASVLFMVYYGLGTGASMLGAQYWGKGDVQPIRVIQGIALRFSLLITLVFSGFAFFAPELMMQLFTNDTELIAIGAEYLRVMSITYLCWGIIEVYLAILRSIGRVTVSMILNVMAFSLNIFLNAVFIFGLFGAPKLGAVGVAIATALSRIIELAGCIVVSIFSRDIKLKVSYMFLHSKLLFQDFVRLSLPALLNDVAWSVAFSMYSVILGHMGSDAVAANSLVVVVRNFGTVLCFGTASAGGILLGNVMGEGGYGAGQRIRFQADEAHRHCRRHRRCAGAHRHPFCPALCKAFRNRHALSEIYAAHQHLLYHGRRRQYDPDCRCVPGRRRQPFRPDLRYH